VGLAILRGWLILRAYTQITSQSADGKPVTHLMRYSRHNPWLVGYAWRMGEPAYAHQIRTSLRLRWQGVARYELQRRTTRVVLCVYVYVLYINGAG
jgi:hypothetical protein